MENVDRAYQAAGAPQPQTTVRNRSIHKGMTLRMAAGAAVVLALCGRADAQQKVEWKQTVNTPKGLSLPKDVKADFLGIELGDTYAEAKPKLQKLLSEAMGPPKASGSTPDRSSSEMTGESQAEPLSEAIMELRLQTPGGFITASYPGQLTLARKMKGTTNQPIRDQIDVTFSAPSSGQQVIGASRSINYMAQGDQPRISQILAGIREKFKVEPQQINSTDYRIQFDDGRGYVPATVNPSTGCVIEYKMQGARMSDVATAVNKTGKCDVVLLIQFQYGISNDHAQAVTFHLSDNERTKINLSADFAFLKNYASGMQSGQGAAPKL
jgi:hypothetical protein